MLREYITNLFKDRKNYRWLRRNRSICKKPVWKRLIIEKKPGENKRKMKERHLVGKCCHSGAQNILHTPGSLRCSFFKYAKSWWAKIYLSWFLLCVRHLWWVFLAKKLNGFMKSTTFAKAFILDKGESNKYTPEYYLVL